MCVSPFRHYCNPERQRGQRCPSLTLRVTKKPSPYRPGDQFPEILSIAARPKRKNVWLFTQRFKSILESARMWKLFTRPRFILWHRWLALALLGLMPIGVCQAGEKDSLSPGFIKGISWGWDGARGSYSSPAAAESMAKLAETGAEWVCISFAAYMTTAEDPDFTWGDRTARMVTDDEIRHAIDLARKHHLKVILKPVINCQDGIWRAWIKFYRPLSQAEIAAGAQGELDPWGVRPVMRTGEVKDREKWDTWWSNYSAFLVHYAKIAEEKDVQILCVGCEMSSTEEFEDQWRSAIARVREVYQGLITYDGNHGREFQLGWWDCVDFISLSAYYAVPPDGRQTIEEAVKKTTTKEQIVRELKKIKEHVAEVSRKYDKPVLFIETGVTSVRGCARYPWSHPGERLDSPLDEQEQANYYSAMFEVFWGEPWFLGFAWWDWPAQLYPKGDASQDRSFCIYGKQTEAIVRAWYAKPSPR